MRLTIALIIGLMLGSAAMVWSQSWQGSTKWIIFVNGQCPAYRWREVELQVPIIVKGVPLTTLTACERQLP